MQKNPIAEDIESGTATGEVGKTTIATQTFRKIGKLVVFTLAFTATANIDASDNVFKLPWTPDSRYDFIGITTSGVGISFLANSSAQVQKNTGTVNNGAIVFVSGSYIAV